MKKNFHLLVLFLIAGLTSFAQVKSISGTVTKENGDPLSGVSVSVKGAKTATSTNAQGHYTISIPDRNNVVLVFTYVGNKTQELAVAGRSSIDVAMAEEASTLNDVVVIGYQSVRRKDLLASVSSVSAKDLKDIPINSAAEALNGRLAGVTATTSEGSPDAQVRIRVRGGMSITGDNSPLYIIDGVQVENGLSTISPQDIQSIDVLKDAAATAIYGARGANGVIVITTKSGKPGKLVLAYNGYVGVKNLAKELKVLDPYDYVVYQSERSRGAGTTTPNDSTNFVKNFGGWDTLINYKNAPPVDWQKEVFGNTGITTTHNISASGGNKKITYNAGYTFNDEKAIVINSKYIRHIFNLKTDYTISKKIKAGVTGRYTHQDVFGAGVSDDKGASYNRLRNAVKYRPFLSPGRSIDSADLFADPNVGNGLNLVNPLLLANSEYRKKTTDAYNATANINFTIVKNLNFKSTFGYDYNKLVDRQYSDSLTPYAIITGGAKPIAGLDTTIKKTITNSNVLTYSIKNFRNKHDFDFLVGEETYDLKTESRSDLFKGFPAFTSHDDAFKNLGMGTAFAAYPKLGKTRYTNLSFFGRINYSLLDKYLFSFNMRADGASKFLPGPTQWGYFPAASIAWRVKKEDFLKDVSWVNDLKFRVGFGSVGNNRINDYLYIPTFNNGTYYYGINNQTVLAYSSTGLVNEKLQWESTVNRNYGVDVSLFNNRLGLSFDIYNNTSDHLLLNVPIASTYGYSSQIQNVGKTSNKGVELQLNATILRQKNNLTWSANFNISTNKNKVLKLGINQNSFFPATSWFSSAPADYTVKIGSPVGSMYGFIVNGFYKVEDFNYNTATGIYTLKSGVVNDSAAIGSTVQPGSIKYKDIDGDGYVDVNHDRTIIGDATPKLTGGLNQQFTYKQWDMSVFVNFSYGNDVYNANKIEFSNGYTNNANLLASMSGRWKVVTPTGQTAQWVSSAGVRGIPPDQLAALNANATIWQPLRSGTAAFYSNSYAIEDGSFLRLNNITIGYTLPVKKLVNLKMSKLRFYVTGNNVAILTNYTGYDPEVSVKNNGTTPGLDYSAYPKSRSFIFGVNATF